MLSFWAKAHFDCISYCPALKGGAIFLVEVERVAVFAALAMRFSYKFVYCSFLQLALQVRQVLLHIFSYQFIHKEIHDIHREF